MRRIVLSGSLACGVAVLLSVSASPHFPKTPAQTSSRQLTLRVDPAQSHVHFTVGTTLHTVHGTFKLQRGSVGIDLPTGRMNGEVAVDATSAKTGNTSRDKKMHRDVLESSNFQEIVFRPDHIEGTVSPEGKSSVQLHGTVLLHGATHEISLPVQANLAANHWDATGTFHVPYIQWGLKNPGNFLLKVDPVVDVSLDLSGTLQTSSGPLR